MCSPDYKGCLGEAVSGSDQDEGGRSIGLRKRRMMLWLGPAVEAGRAASSVIRGRATMGEERGKVEGGKGCRIELAD